MASKGSGMRVVVYDEHDKIPSVIRQAMLETVESFYHLKSCISFIQQYINDDRAIILVTTTMDINILNIFEELESIECILILSQKEKDIDILPSKIIGIYSEIENLLRSLFEALDKMEIQLDANSILFHKTKNGHDNTDFYFYYLWETYNINQIMTKKILVDHARIIFRLDNQVKPFIHDFNTTYKSSEILYWLDKYDHPFPYHLLVSNALRTHDQQILSLVRFFIFDLIKKMKPLLNPASTNQVYFGTKLPISIVDRLEQQTSKDIIAFQCFLPTTRSRTNALLGATRSTRRKKIANVLFKIDATNVLCAHLGDIILLNMATPFHVVCVTRNTGFGGVQQLVTVVTLIALDKEKKSSLLTHFIEKQKRAGKSIYDFLQRTIPIVRLDNIKTKKNCFFLHKILFVFWFRPEPSPVRRTIESKTSVATQPIPLYVVQVTKPIQPSLAVWYVNYVY